MQGAMSERQGLGCGRCGVQGLQGGVSLPTDNGEAIEWGWRVFEVENQGQQP